LCSLESLEGPDTSDVLIDEARDCPQESEGTDEERGTDPEREPKEVECRWNDGGIAEATTCSWSFS